MCGNYNESIIEKVIWLVLELWPSVLHPVVLNEHTVQKYASRPGFE